MATSVPVPIAIPTSAAASAGASLTPSPAIATTRPSACRRRTTSALRSGSTSASTRSIPTARATTSAAARLSPVSITISRPSARSARIASARLGLDADRRPRRAPRRRRPRPAARRCAPSRRSVSASASKPETSTPDAARNAGCPEHERASLDVPAHSPPRLGGEVRDRRQRESALAGGRDDRGRERVLAALLEARRQAQRLGVVGAGRTGDTRDTRAALGERAGLVDDQRRDARQGLERLGVPDQHAGRGSPADADHDRHRRREAERAGAGDDQHGDRGHERVGEAGLGADERPGQERERAPRPRPPARTRRRCGRRAAGWARGCAAPRSRARRCARAASRAPTRSARITKPPVPLSVAPVTRRSGPFATGIGSPLIIDSSTLVWPSSTTPSVGTRSPGPDAQAVSGTHGVERHVGLRAVRLEPARGVRREADERADRVARALRAPRARAPGPPAPA